MALDYVEGFEHQVASVAQFGASGTGIFDGISNPSAITFVTGRLGGFALQVAQDGATATNARRELPATQHRTIGIWILMTTAPGIASKIFTFFDAGGSIMGNLRCGTGGLIGARGGTGAYNDGPQIADGNWHRVTMHLDTSGTTWTINWAVDGVAQTAASQAAHVATDCTRISYGSGTSTENATATYDDVVGSPLSADHPIARHRVIGRVPNADASHNSGVNIIEDETGADIGTAWSRLDEWPANTTDYVRQNAAGSTNYAEVAFEDKLTSASILGVMAYAAAFASSSTAETGNPTTRMVDGSNNTLVDVFSGDMSETTLNYITALVPPPGAGWDSGFNGVKCRIGFRSDAVGGHPRWSALMLQYACIEASTVTMAAAVTATATVAAATVHTATLSPHVSATATITATITTLAPLPSLGVLLASNVGPASTTNLNGSLSSGALSITVVSTFSTQARDNFTSPYIIEIDSERILISSSTPTVLTVATGGRGYQGTTPAAHADGAICYFTYIVDRNSGLGYSVESEEAQIRVDSGNPTFRYGAHRRHYGDMTKAFPYDADSADGRMQRDWDADRLIIWSTKAGGSTTWAQTAAASPSVNVAVYNQIVARGNEVAAWQNAKRGLGRHGANIVWAYHHEPEGDDATAAISGSSTASVGRDNWRAAYENIITIWTGLPSPVTEWQGTFDGNTTVEGVIVAMNLTWGPSQPTNLGDLWWPTSWTWGNAHMVMAAADSYNRGPVWRRFADVMGAAGITQNGRYKQWSDARRITQAAAGKPFMQAIFETGCLEFYSGEYNPGSVSAAWTALGIPPTKANWYLDFRDYVRDSWPELFAVCFFDSNTNSIAEWPHDTSQEAWDAWVGITQDPVFAPEPDAVAPTAAIVGTPQLFTVDATSFVTASVTLAAKPTFISVETAQADPPDPTDIPTISASHGTTWTVIGSQQTAAGTVRRRATVFLGFPTAGSGVITVNTTQTQQNCAVHIEQWANASATNPVVQFAAVDGNSFGAITIPFADTVADGNSVFVFGVLNNNTGLSPGVGYSTIAASTLTSPVSSAMSAFINASDDPADFSINGTTNFRYAAIAVEVRASAAANVVTMTAHLAATSSIVAAMNVIASVRVQATATISATMILPALLEAHVSATATIAAAITRTRFLAASVSAVSTIRASILSGSMSAQVIAHATISASMSTPQPFAAAVKATATITAEMVTSTVHPQPVNQRVLLSGGPVPPTPSSW